MTPSSGTTRTIVAPRATGPPKIVVYPGIKKTQIFDMTSDPYETNNLYGKPEGTKLHAPLLATLKQLQKQLGDNLDIDYPTGA